MLKPDRGYSVIRDTNLPSQRVALRNDGMRVFGTLAIDYYGRKMPHTVFCAENGEIENFGNGFLVKSK